MQDVVASVEAVQAFRPTPAIFWIATTAPVDAQLQQAVRQLPQDWPFLVYVRAWNDLQLAITRFPDLVEQFWPWLSQARVSVARIRNMILDSDPASFRKVFGENGEMRFVHDGDVQLAIVVPDESDGPFDEGWIDSFPANALPPRPAKMVGVQIRFAGEILAKFTFVWLDGTRYLLPLPPPTADADRIVDAMQAALGRIVEQGVMHSFDEGIKRAGIRVVPVHHDSQREWLRE